MPAVLDRKLAEPLIVIVDDDASVRHAIERLLKSFGHDVAGYDSVKQYLRSKNLTKTIALILDVKMPGLTGLDLQNIIRGLHASIPIIFITAHPNEDARDQALRLGAIGFLEKPFDDQALIALLSKVLEQSE